MEAPQPQEPPQQPPPDVLVPMSMVSSESPAPAYAKLETSTRVLVDSHEGQTCAWSRSANRVRSWEEQCGHGE